MKHYIITGHYGSGKSNIAVNAAIELKKSTDKLIYLIDADIVNPYFRSADSREILEKNNINLITPIFANTNLDVPSIPADIFTVFSKDCLVIWDIGGDNAGAIVLGRFQRRIIEQGYEMTYVVNAYRPLTETSDDMLEYMMDIETASHLKANNIINNSNLGSQTTPKTVLDSFDIIREFSVKAALPVAYVSVNSDITSMEHFNLLKESEFKIKEIILYTKKYF